jgi:hypothetical protein
MPGRSRGEWPHGEDRRHALKPVFFGEEQRSVALALYRAFIETLPWGAKIVGLRIHLPSAPQAVVAQLLRQAWSAKAPKALQ